MQLKGTFLLILRIIDSKEYTILNKKKYITKYTGKTSAFQLHVRFIPNKVLYYIDRKYIWNKNLIDTISLI